MTLVDRVMSKVEKGSAGDCWPWTASLNGQGYGVVFMPGGRRVRAHRVVYELLVGPIPPGLQIDHLCHNRAEWCLGGSACAHRRCVNPEHLEPATNRENTRRGRAPETNRKRQVAKTHCKSGHPLSGDNVSITEHGFRTCRACRRASSRRHLGDRPTTRSRGPLRRVVDQAGRQARLECGHVLKQESGNKPVRMHCYVCDEAMAVTEPPMEAA